MSTSSSKTGTGTRKNPRNPRSRQFVPPKKFIPVPVPVHFQKAFGNFGNGNPVKGHLRDWGFEELGIWADRRRRRVRRHRWRWGRWAMRFVYLISFERKSIHPSRENPFHSGGSARRSVSKISVFAIVSKIAISRNVDIII